MARVNTWEQGHTLKLGIAMIKTKGVDSVQFKNVAINEEAALVIVRSIKFKVRESFHNVIRYNCAPGELP